MKSLLNEHGQTVKATGPGTAAEIIGWRDLPRPGDLILEVESEVLLPQGFCAAVSHHSFTQSVSITLRLRDAVQKVETTVAKEVFIQQAEAAAEANNGECSIFRTACCAAPCCSALCGHHIHAFVREVSRSRRGKTS